MSSHRHCKPFLTTRGLRSAIESEQERSGTISWALYDEFGTYHPQSLLMKLNIRHPRDKERTKVRTHSVQGGFGFDFVWLNRHTGNPPSNLGTHTSSVIIG